ncbi:MAG: hypothetical protein IJM77_00960 [Spirochaetia bacterium]|nr:hypothetical protein [Spirochaetia bacterium]MBQ3648005.1 hypothetical protein [Spirochaetia bacterium]MBQ3713430.1 hypothetical protein [Spirochaetia bacterium]MBQ6673180.1 hypothetical protein [Spirochaetia bacterium]MBR0318819.1 hypothetical protein [Spirochaetia bacterium]
MRFRMILFVIFICFYALFAALNLSNATDINFGFISFSHVPIFLAVTVAFALGALFMLPLALVRRKPKEKKEKPVKEKKKKGKEPIVPLEQPEENKPL